MMVRLEGGPYATVQLEGQMGGQPEITSPKGLRWGVSRQCPPASHFDLCLASPDS